MILLETFLSIVLCFILTFCNNVNARLAPDFIHPCKELTRECLVQAVKDAIPGVVKGVPELGFPTLDPFDLENVPLQLPGIAVKFVKGQASGFRTCIPDNVEINLQEKFFKMDFHCNITIKGLYEAKGKLLNFPIDGAGDAKIKLKNMRMKLHINSKYTKDDKGLRHFNVKDYKYRFDYGDKVTFDLKNLFKDSKELSDLVLQFLNDNWKLVSEEFGQPILDYAVELALKTIVKFFEIVPCEELIGVPLPEDL